jgi:hypothetical protein
MEFSQTGEKQIDKDDSQKFCGPPKRPFIYGKSLGNFFYDTQQDGDFDDREIIFMSNLKEVNSFKIFDESNNGNHFVQYNDEWI